MLSCETCRKFSYVGELYLVYRLVLNGDMFVRLRLINYFYPLNDSGATDFDAAPNACLFLTVLACLTFI